MSPSSPRFVVSRSATRAIALLAAAALVVACRRSGERPNGTAAPRSVVLVTVEAIRSDLLSTYGGPVAMASLDKLAAVGVVYDDATTPIPVGRPAATALLTGIPPDRNGVRDDVGDRLSTASETLAEAFSRSGRRTAAFVGTQSVGWESGLDRGFALFDAPEMFLTGPMRIFPRSLPASGVAGNFAKWVAALKPAEPFFAWVHLADLRGIVARSMDPNQEKTYRESLGKIDESLGAIVAAVSGRERGPVDVVVAGTHGLLLPADGARGADCWLRRETLRVPLVWKRGGATSPGSAGRHVTRAVTLLDVAATLTAVARGGTSSSHEGTDLFAGSEAPPATPRMAWTWAPDDRFARTTLTAVEDGGTWKTFTESDIDRLRATTPAAGTAEAAAVARPATPRRRQVPPSTRTRLETAGGRLGRGDRAPAAFPTDMAAFVQQRDEIAYLIGVGHLRVASKKAGEILEKEPNDFAALYYRLYASLSLEDLEDAARVAAKLLESYPERQEALHWAAHVAQLKKDLPRAEALLEAAYEIGPPEPDLLYDRACARSLQGDVGGALTWLEKAVAAGFRQWEWMEKDTDLVAVRADSRFAEIMRTQGH